MEMQQNPQQPPQAPALLNLTDAQIALLTQAQTRLKDAICGILFNEPEKDDLRIRQHAEMHGRLSTITGLLQFDRMATESYADAVREYHANNPVADSDAPQ